jgi:hypothetical protein
MFIKIVVDDLDVQAAFYATVLGQVAKHRVSREGFEEIVTSPVDGDGPSTPPECRSWSRRSSPAGC